MQRSFSSALASSVPAPSWSSNPSMLLQAAIRTAMHDPMPSTLALEATPRWLAGWWTT